VMQQAEKMGIMVAWFFSVTPKGGNMSDVCIWGRWFGTWLF
jgi:hypothetical protein